jgi:hypothetical protein
MKFRVFWDVAPCSHVETDQRIIALMMEAVRTSETLDNFNVTTWRYIPEGSKLLSVLPPRLPTTAVKASIFLPWIYLGFTVTQTLFSLHLLQSRRFSYTTPQTPEENCVSLETDVFFVYLYNTAPRDRTSIWST